MASSSVDHIEAHTKIVAEAQPAIIPYHLPLPTTITANSQLPTNAEPPPSRSKNTNGHRTGNSPAQQTVDNSQVQRDENHGDSSDGLWSMYLTEAEKQDAEVTESWKGDTDGILVFTGLFSATVASFIIESYQNLSPNSSDTTNALLTQISQQLVNISSGTPLTSVTVQSGQLFKPTASAVRVNILWFLSLILSLTCALSATLMQQWARRYREFAQRRGAFHRRGRMRAYIFEGVSKFGMTRAVATMPTLLHISVFLFFAGLLHFIFPICVTVAYAILGCIMIFALAYAILTVLPIIYLNCPYGTPLSGSTWRISQFSVFVFLWTILKIEGLFRKPLLRLWSLANQHVAEPHRHKTWRETIEEQVKIHRHWFSQSLRRTVQLSAYEAKSTAVTSALEWTLAALDEDKEIEDFAARVPGFFDSRIVLDATSAVLSLMSHQPNTDPIIGSRLYDLLQTCIPGTSVLDETTRKHRLRVCLKCLWYFGRAYNQPGVSHPLPSYFPNSLIPEITRRVQAEEDSALRMIGHCAVAVIINKLAADLESRAIPINDEELACLSATLGTKSRDVEFLLSQPGAVALANTISFTFDKIGGLITDTVPSGVLDVVQQTLGALSQALSSQGNTEVRLVQPIAIINGSDGMFERIFLSRLIDLLDACIQITPPRTEGERMSCGLVCLKGLWYFGRAFNQPGNSVPLPSYVCAAFTNLEMTRLTCHDPATSVITRCVQALVVNKLVSDPKSRTIPVSDRELACLSAVLGTRRDDMMLLLSHPGAVEFTNMVFWGDFYVFNSMHSDVLDMVQQTFGILSQSQALPPGLNSKMQLNQSGTLRVVSDGTSPLAAEMHGSILGMCMKNLWDFTRAYNEPGNMVSLPSYVWITFTNPEMTRRIRKQRDRAVRMIGRCIEALIVNKLAADINSRNVPVSNDELACLSAILDTKSNDVVLSLRHPGTIELMNVVFLISDDFYTFELLHETVPLYVLDVVKQTIDTLFRALPPGLNINMQLNKINTLMNASDGTSSLVDDVYGNVLRVWMKNLWDFTREYNECGNSAPLPSYIYIAFANPEMTRRIHEQHDLAVRVIGRCVNALVVNKLAAYINSHNVPVNEDEVACLSAILGAESHDVKLCLSQSGIIELVNLASLALGDDGSLLAYQMPLHTRSVFQQTLGILSQALPALANIELPPDQMVALRDVSDDKFERTIVSRLHDLSKMCIPGASSLMEEVRTSCLRMCLKSLWHSGKTYHQTSGLLPSYFPLMLAGPEIIRHFQTEQDPVIRITRCCFGALIVSKLVDALRLPNSLSGGTRSAELACVSAILGTVPREVELLPHQLRVINLRNVVSILSDEVYTLSTLEGMTKDVLNIAQDTLYVLANRLHARLSEIGSLPINQQRSVQERYSDIVNALSSDQLKNETSRTLNRLRRMLESLLHVMEIQ